MAAGLAVAGFATTVKLELKAASCCPAASSAVEPTLADQRALDELHIGRELQARRPLAEAAAEPVSGTPLARPCSAPA